MSLRPSIVAGVLAMSLQPVFPAEPNAAPPVAPRVEHRETRHDSVVVDHYYWLREKSNPNTLRYLEAENAYTEAMTRQVQPFADALYKEMLGRIKQTDLSVPTRRGGYLYYSRTEEGKQYPIQCRRKGSMEAPEEILLDLNELAKGHTFLGLGAFVISDNESLLAYTTDVTGFRQYSLHIKDLRSGATLPDTAQRVTSVAWAADNATLFYTTEDPVTKRSDHLFSLKLGTPSQALYQEGDELFRVHVSRTKDKKYLMLDIGATDTTEVRYLAASQPAGAWKVFLAREKKHRYDVEHREGLFYIRTNRDAKNFQIVTAPDNAPEPANWKPFIAHQPDVLVQRIELFKNYAVVLEKSEALNRIRYHDFRSGQWRSVAFPEPVYSAFPGGTPEYDSQVFRYTYTSMITPPSVYDYDMAAHRGTLLKRQEVLGGVRPGAVCLRTAVGDGARRSAGADLHRL